MAVSLRYSVKNVQDWTASDTSQWLSNLGPNYTELQQTFLDEGIDGKVLVQLTEMDIADLVPSKIQRKKLLVEIQNLRPHALQPENPYPPQGLYLEPGSGRNIQPEVSETSQQVVQYALASMEKEQSPSVQEVLKKHDFILFHVSRYRSTRVVWMYYELKQRYPDMPDLYIHEFDQTEFRSNKDPKFLRLNPNGKVPLLVDNRNGRKIKMWDSVAICFYLVNQFDVENQLFLEDPRVQTLCYQFSFYVSGTVDNLTATSSPIQRVLHSYSGDDSSQVLQRRFWEEVAGGEFEKLLQAANGPYLFGKTLSFLDVVFGCNAFWMSRYKRNWLVDGPFLMLQHYFEHLLTNNENFRKSFKIDEKPGNNQVVSKL